MKKTVVIILFVLMTTMLLVSCKSKDMWEPPAMTVSSVSKNSVYDNGSMPAPAPAPAAPPMDVQTGGGEYDYSYSEITAIARTPGESGVVPVTAPIVDDSLAEKIIYTVSADIETVNFDETVESVYQLLTVNGGFIESSNIGGRNYAQSYNSWQTYRNAQFSLRIPVSRLNAVTASLDSLGNVTSLRSDADNITAQFFDTQSRLNSYKIQEERLLDMLSKADNVTDMIEIERRLADIRYEIESLTSTLRNWQNRVDYSTLTLFISEVQIFTEIEPVQQRTYWQQIGDGLKASAKSVGNFFTGLFKWLAINLPVLLILAVIAVAIVLLIKRQLKRRAKKAKQKPQHQKYRYGQPYPQYPPNMQYPPNIQQQPNAQQPPSEQQAPNEQYQQSQQNTQEPAESQDTQNPQD